MGDGICYEIELPLKFEMIQILDADQIEGYGAVFDVVITQQNNEPLDSDYFTNYLEGPELFLISPASKISTSQSVQTEFNTIRISLNFAEDEGGEEFTLEFSPDPAKRTLPIDLEERTHTIDIQTSPQFEPEELE